MPTNNLAPKAKNKLGIASSIPPNVAERFGAAVSPYLQGAQALFPPTNPYGQVVSNFLLGQAPQAAQQMAAGYPNVLFNTSNPLGGKRIVNPVALDMALALPVATAVKGAGMAGGGVAATFAGARAKTANHAALALAEEMKVLGTPDEEIYKATGWFFGSADGKPRFEIPDNQAKLRASNFEKYDFSTSPNKSAIYEGTVAGGIKHDQLTNAYPDVGDIKYAGSYEYGPSTMGRVEPSGLVTGRASGVYQPHINKINVSSGYAENIAGAKNQTKSTTLHELQHAIQQRENFAKGGSPEQFTKYDQALLEQENAKYSLAMKELIRTYKESGKSALDAMNSPQGKVLGESLNKLQDAIKNPFGQYRRLAGEAEARLTQSRMDMTGAERAASYPPGMYDVPVGDQIVRYGEGPALATTWHGSPHLFPPTPTNNLGEFNAAKIGTGEGAQAYGMGHYTGEARGTGEGYRNQLAKTQIEPGDYAEYFASGSVRPSYGGHDKILDFDPESGIVTAQSVVKNKNDEWVPEPNSQVRRHKTMPNVAELEKTLGRKPGYLYKVDIPDEQIAQMLDWDKPLSQQSESVRKALEKASPSVKTVDTMSREELINTLQYIDRNGSYTDEMMINEFGRPATLDELRESARMMEVDEYLAENVASDKHATGKSAYKQLVAKFGGGENQSTAAGQAKASELLQKAGIPGIRYLDAGSRGAEGGTSNFVVFPGNESMMTILERNGQAMSPESQAIARYREIKGPKSVVRMEAALRTAGVPLPKNEPVAYIQGLVDRAHRRN
jgi:Large polyvalent protein associated domain 23